MKYKKYKKFIIIGVILLAIGLILYSLSNSTYAFFSGDTYADRPEDYSTGTLEITASSKSDTISLTNALPMSDSEGVKTTPYVFSIKNTGNLDYKFDVKLLSTGNSSTSFLPQYIKVQVDDGDVTTLAELTNGVIKSNIFLAAGESMDISLRVWLDIDTPNSEIGKSFNSSIVTDGIAVYTEDTEYDGNIDYNVTPLSDFSYILIEEDTTLTSLDYIDENGDIITFPFNGEMYKNEVLLSQYMGSSENVVVPNTYVVNGVTYNVTLLSEYYDNDVLLLKFGVFQRNNTIKSVTLGDNISFIYGLNDLGGYLYSGRNSTDSLFYNCTNLVNVPAIPNSVTDMSFTFSGCTSLVNAPVIPSSVTSMNSTFSGCTSLVNAPDIPDSVKNMNSTFSGCTSLVEAPSIGSSVTSMDSTFKGCTNLTGVVYLLDPEFVTDVDDLFDGTVKPIEVCVWGDSVIESTLVNGNLPANVKIVVF